MVVIETLASLVAIVRVPMRGTNDPYTPPTKPSDPITQTARRIRERRRNECGGGELWGILVLLVVGGLVAALFAG